MIFNQVGGTPFGDTKMLRIGAPPSAPPNTVLHQGSDPDVIPRQRQGWY